MPVNILPHLRHLNPTLPVAGFSLMKPNPTIKPSRVIPILSRVFPHKLKFHSFAKKVGFSNLSTSLSNQELSMSGARQLSTVRASRSLIDDEADLSDWVSDLSSNNSKKNRSFSDSDDGFGRAPRGGGRGRGRGGGGGRGEGRFSSVKRQRDDDSDGNDNWSSYNLSNSREGRGGGRGGRFGGSNFDRKDDRFSRGGRGGGRGGRFGGGDFDRKDDRFLSRRESGYGGGRGEGGSSRGRNDGFSSRRESGYGNGREEGGGLSGGRRNAGSFDSFSRGSSGRGRFGNEGGRGNGDYSMSRGRGSESDNSSSRGRGRGRGNRGSLDSFTRNSRGVERFGGRSQGEDDTFSSRRRDESSRGSGVFSKGGKSSVRGSLLSVDKDSEDDLDDEEGEGEEKLMGSFRDLISEDDEDEDEDEDDNDDGDDAVVVDEEESDDADDYDMLTKGKSLSGLDDGDSLPVTPRSPPGASDSYLSDSRFDQCPISALSLKAIKDAGYEKMTIVQEATLPVILKGKDVLAKAKTGTGKTVAFLLPSIELIAKLPPTGRDQKRPPICVLVICPTRELANQAAVEANKLVKYHPSIGVQVVIGGTRLTLEQKRMQANPCQILVATPGRLKDHIENTAGFATRLMGVKVLVLDEADHLLDMGFRKDIERIIAAVPKQRQTLLFSATVPSEVRQICHIALNRDHEFINTVKDTEETHAQVRQTHLIAPLDKQLPLLYALLKDHIADDPEYKVLVFCTTAMVTKFVANLLGELKLNVREIHSRKPQSYRTRISDEFRKSKGLILVTSDVSARGVDYPDVTLVIQVGLPSDKQQYIHRLGRTGRKGKEGQGILMLAPWEEFFLSTLRELPISKAELPLVDPDKRKLVEKALCHVEMKNKESAYQAWLGYYNSNKTVGKDKHKLVELANEFSRCMGLDNPPAIPKMVLGKMGLRNVPGLRSK